MLYLQVLAAFRGSPSTHCKIPVNDLKAKFIERSPGRNLLKTVKTSSPAELTVEKFKEISHKLQRLDVVQMLEETNVSLMIDIDEGIQL